MGRLKDVISPRLRGLRGQSLNHNVCTAHHDHGKLFFGVKLFYATFITRKQFTACWTSSPAPGKFQSGDGPSARRVYTSLSLLPEVSEDAEQQREHPLEAAQNQVVLPPPDGIAGKADAAANPKEKRAGISHMLA